MVRIEDLFVGEDLLQRAVEKALSLPPEETAVVFPGRRAVSHFALAFARRRGGPCRPPALLTVAGLARKTAGLPAEGPEPLESLRLLLRAVKAVGQDPRPGFCGDLVSFYGPGRAWLEALETLEEEEVPDGALASLRNQSFFDALAPSSRAFHDLLPTLRAAYRELCAREGAWTDAQAIRRAAEHLEGEGRGPWRHLLFVGFFSLTGGQIRLLRALSASAEVTLLRHHDGRRWEAFRRMEAALAPCHPAPPFAPPRLSLTVEEAPSAHGEALRVGEILSREGLVPEETVVVLPDPDTLLPLLWEGLGVLEEDFNVTLGYPLARSPLFTLLDAVLRAAEEGDGESVPRQAYLRLLFHPYVKNFAPEGQTPGSLRIFFHAVQEFLLEEGWRRVDLRALEAEAGPRRRARTLNPEGPGEEGLSASLVRVHDLFFREVRAAGNLTELAVLLERLLGAVAEGSPAPYHPFYRPSFQAAARCLEVLAEAGRGEEGSAPEPRSLFAFVRERLSEVRVPFTGLPVRGLQVMGVLETQVLRFPSVILLDADDEGLPTVPPPDPLLPPAFRKALGLPGVLERAEIYRYHVFRLLESSGRAWALYAARPGRGLSPFVGQLLWEARRAGGEGKVSRLAFRTGGQTEPVGAVPKSPELLARLRSLALSPTSLDRYLKCPLIFYWETALSLREPEAEEETDDRAVGKILHGVLAELFQPLAGRVLTEGDFGEMKTRLPSLLEGAFRGRDAGFLLASLAEERLGQVIDQEKARWEPQARVAAVEEKVELDLAEGGGPPVRVEGRLDRLDALPGGRFRLTDYKSGKDLQKGLPSKEPPDVQADRRTLWKGLRSLQLPLYAEMVRRSRSVPAEALEARLVSLREPGREAKLEERVSCGLASFLDHCVLPVVRRLAAEILDPDLPFEADPADPQECKKCPYAPLCRRPRRDPDVY